MDRIKRIVFVSLLAGGLTAIPAKAEAYYTYSGDTYTSSQSPLGSSSYISFTMAFDDPLAANLDNFDENANAHNTWSVTDQTNSLSHDDNAYWDFYISTDSSGNITDWDITITGQYSGTAFSTAYGGLNGAPDTDQSSYNVSETSYSGSVDGSDGSPQGSWSVDNTALPEPSTTVMMGISGIMLLFREMRRRASNHSGVSKTGPGAHNATPVPRGRGFRAGTRNG